MEGPARRTILNVANASSIAIASQAVVYTQAIPLPFALYFGIRYKASSVSGSPDLLIQIEQSDQAPATEGAADLNFVIPVSMADIETNLTTELWKVKTISPVPLRYIRFKITGNAGNPADTLFQAFLSIQEDY